MNRIYQRAGSTAVGPLAARVYRPGDRTLAVPYCGYAGE